MWSPWLQLGAESRRGSAFSRSVLQVDRTRFALFRCCRSYAEETNGKESARLSSNRGLDMELLGASW